MNNRIPERFHELPRTAKQQYDRLEWHFYNWARWMRSGGKTQFHVGGGLGLQGFTHFDTESSYDKSDNDTAIMVDAIIRDLKQMERDSLHTEYLGKVWPNKPEILGMVLVLAREQVQAGIRKRGLI